MPGIHVDVPTGDGVADSYLARPDDERHPGVLMLMDAFGLRPTLEEMADRVAAGGYVVLVPNLFYRAGRAPVLEAPDLSDADARMAFFGKLRPLMDDLTPERLAADGAAYADYLAGVASAGPIGITGYCMGGRAGWRIAAALPERVAALGAFHAGGLVTDEPDSPHQSAALLRARLYFGFADEDQSMTAEQIATVEGALEEAGASYRSEVYGGAHHGYTMADSPAFDEAARERHFRELDALLNETLG